MMISIRKVYDFLSRPFRKKRMKLFMQTFNIKSTDKILDVGGTPFNWQMIDCPAQITLMNINIPNPLPQLPSNIKYCYGDGTNIQFSDKSFDIVFSNSVIEHINSYENQFKFSKEIQRVGKQFWVQTPSPQFFFDPHFITPFFHWLPQNIQLKMARNFTIWGWITRPSKDKVKELVQQIRLLTFKEFSNLFSNCYFQKEKFLGIAIKSFIAYQK